MDKSYLNALLHLMPEEIRIDLLVRGIRKIEISGGSPCLRCEIFDGQDNKLDVLLDGIKESLSWVIGGLVMICALEKWERVKMDLADNRLIMDDTSISDSRVKFVEFGDGTIQLLGGKYDGATLYEITDYHFLYESLSGDLIERIYSKIKEHADDLKMLDELEVMEEMPLLDEFEPAWVK